MSCNVCISLKALFLFAASPLAHACTADIDGAPAHNSALPRLLVASAESRVGGEAHFEGKLLIEGNCVIVISNGRKILPIFDSSVKLAEAGDAIFDSRGEERIGNGEHLRASAAYLREEGSGWSLASIEKFTGAGLPQDCGDTIVRLRSIKKAAG